MRTLNKSALGLMMMLFISQTFAITVNVSSPVKDLTGIGFTAKGSKHGGMGNKYKGEKMPKGMYIFGMRKDGKDIGCVDKNGKKKIKLNKSSRIVLKMKGGKCIAEKK